jgi:hypothetical protein
MSAKSASIDAIARGMKNEENRAVNGLPKINDKIVIDAINVRGTDTSKMTAVSTLQQPLVTRAVTIPAVTVTFKKNDFH